MKRACALILLAIITACAHNDPQSTANAVTRAVFENNQSAVTAYFDDALRPQVTRASVGVLSDKMHALGSYNGLTLIATDTSKHEYTYRANFTKGTMNVIVRVDPDGRLAAYRVFPTS
ncbi:MAG TPA: hypothetical protein VF741_05255 [Candidatus Aquilonibacter sp.]